MEEFKAMFQELLVTDVTTKTHRDVYPAINPTRPELSQAGQVVLVTGGGTGVGYGISKAFVLASADTLIIIGRRTNVLEEAATKLRAVAKEHGSPTKIITQGCDVTNPAEVQKFWDDLSSNNMKVDVLIANVAKFTEPKPLLELGADEVWSQIEVNLKAPLYFTEKFCAQNGDKQKFIVNTSTQAVHMTAHVGVAVRPAYTLSKMAGNLLFQLIAQNNSPEQLQVINFHPGVIYNDQWEAMGLSTADFDSNDLSGGFAVWAATKQAQFLHGRFVWAAWDVDELSTGELRKKIDEDPYFLRASIVGLNGALRA